MIKNQTYRNVFQSTKSLGKFKLEATNKIHQLIPAARAKEEGNSYSITANVNNYSSNKEGNKMEDNYLKRIKYLENELKKQLTDDAVLRNLFKVKMPPQITHLDLYLEIRRLEQTVKTQTECEKQSKHKLCSMQNALQRQEQQHMKYIEMLGSSIEEKEKQWRSQKNQLQEINRQLHDQYEDNKYLLEEIKKKYSQLNHKYKEINNELEIQKSAKYLQILQSKYQNQSQTNQYLLEIDNQKRQIQDLCVQLNELKLSKHEENFKQRQQFQYIKDQKQKLQLRIRQIEEISNDYVQQNKNQKEKHIQIVEKLRLQYEQKQQSMMLKLQQEQKQFASKEQEMMNRITQMQNNIDLLKNELKIHQQMIKSLEKQKLNLTERQKLIERQLAVLQKKNVKLSIQLMQVRCQKDQQIKMFAKERLQLEDKENFMRNLQSKRMTTHSKNVPDLKSEIQKKYFRF